MAIEGASFACRSSPTWEVDNQRPTFPPYRRNELRRIELINDSYPLTNDSYARIIVLAHEGLEGAGAGFSPDKSIEPSSELVASLIMVTQAHTRTLIVRSRLWTSRERILAWHSPNWLGRAWTAFEFAAADWPWACDHGLPWACGLD